jgi:hypothetical protein
MVNTLHREYTVVWDTLARELIGTAPPEVIDSWPKPNYVDPETRGPALVIVSIILASMGLLMVTARLYARYFITKAPGWDDALIVVGLAFGIALSALVCVGNKFFYSGYHIWDVPHDKYVGHRVNVWVGQIFSRRFLLLMNADRTMVLRLRTLLRQNIGPPVLPSTFSYLCQRLRDRHLDRYSLQLPVLDVLLFQSSVPVPSSSGILVQIRPDLVGST